MKSIPGHGLTGKLLSHRGTSNGADWPFLVAPSLDSSLQAFGTTAAKENWNEQHSVIFG